MCGHQWTYKQKLLGYAIKPRTRIKCPDCKEYIEPATISVIFDYLAVIVLSVLVFIVVPFMHLPVDTSVLITGILIALYIFLFIPFTVKFKKYDYNIKTPR